MKSPEGFEKDDICKYLVSILAWFFRPYMAGFGKAGVADIIACIPTVITQSMVGKTLGIFYSIEVKRPGKEPTPRQETRMKEIEAAGGFAVAGDAEHVIRYIKAALEPE